jgi:hypothetical protein
MTLRAAMNILGTVGALLGISSCTDSLKIGALYSVNDGEGWYRIAKVLVVEKDGVHIRLYKNKFKSRPPGIEFASLSLGSIHDKDGFGMGHLPLTHRAFVAWQPVLISEGSVSEEELDGYREWQNAKAGFFGNK